MSHTTLLQPVLTRALSPSFRWLAGLACVGAIAAGGAQAQAVFRIVGPDGRVTFSDKPPATANKVTPVNSAAKETGLASGGLPYELSLVVAKYPVTIYTSADCSPCDEGRASLRARGVPFAEKTIKTAEDADAFKQLINSDSLPALTIGGQRLKGFNSGEWSKYLGAAGYPEKSKLPPSYRNQPPSPLVAAKAVPAATAASKPDDQPMLQPVAPIAPRNTPENPAGIQF